MLWIALELPMLALQLAERGCTSPSPLVIAEGPAQRPLVACANDSASVAGIREGQAVASAKALCGELRVLPRDEGAEREALEQLAGWAGQFTPAVSVDGQGIALEAGSSLKLFGGHAKLAGAVRQGIHDLGYHATIGIAPTPIAARLFARAEAQGLRIRSCVAMEELGGRIAELPLFLFDWPERTLALLADLGVLRIRDILALPREGLARRFGPRVVDELDRLTGRLPDPRVACVAPPSFHTRLELPSEVESTEALLFPLHRLLAQMEGFLRGRGAGVQRLVLTLEPVSGKRTLLELEFASPEREADFILSIAREKLGRTQVAAPTLVIDLRAEALLPFALRSATWLPGRAEHAIGRERLLERLAARIGKDRVFGIAIANDHRPEKTQENRGEGRNI
jgi:protein ImuB